MGEYCYLLNIRELADAPAGGWLWQDVVKRLDADRLCRLEKMKRPGARAACAGAGLLLQWAYAKWRAEAEESRRETKQEKGIRRVEMEEILQKIRSGSEFHICYGTNGKPAIKDHPFFYNLSHSGDYVCCGVSEREIGVDIQKMPDCKEDEERTKKLAERFFAKEEWMELSDIPKEKFCSRFYQLWTRKEAIGKLYGDGLTGWLNKDLKDLDKEVFHHISWEEYEMDKYRICVCRTLEGM